MPFTACPGHQLCQVKCTHSERVQQPTSTFSKKIHCTCTIRGWCPSEEKFTWAIKMKLCLFNCEFRQHTDAEAYASHKFQAPTQIRFYVCRKTWRVYDHWHAKLVLMLFGSCTEHETKEQEMAHAGLCTTSWIVGDSICMWLELEVQYISQACWQKISMIFPKNVCKGSDTEFRPEILYQPCGTTWRLLRQPPALSW
jgi:hypothetical protein